MAAYVEASKALYALFEDTTPLVEGLSIDEAFLDVRGMERIAGTPTEIAIRLRRTARERVGLPLTVGIARTKFLAKLASAVAKPDGLLLVPPENEIAFLHPLPIERVWESGPRLPESSTATGSSPSPTSHASRRRAGGDSGASRRAAPARPGEQPRSSPFRRRARRRSIGAQHALGRSGRSAAEIDTDLVALVDRVTRRLRAARRVGRTVVLRLRFDDFSRATRSHTLAHPTSHTTTVLAAARGLLAVARPLIERRGLTLVGVTDRQPQQRSPLQLCLPLDPDGGALLDAALDEIRNRYGQKAITRAVLLARRTRLTVPLLTD